MIYLVVSPYGMGAILILDGKIVGWFSCPLTHDDCTIHNQTWGDSRGQQTWEALVLLVAIKMWLPYWAEVRTSIHIKGDNLAALALAAKMKSNISSLISKELALVMARASFQPRFLEHVPGAMNVMADALSRIWEPGASYTVPEGLHADLRAEVPPRTRDFYSTLQPKSC